MTEREQVIANLLYMKRDCLEGSDNDKAIDRALELLKAQEAYHHLQVHNIGNVDIPDGVTKEQFHAVMNNVVDALEHTDKGESWPYDEAASDMRDYCERYEPTYNPEDGSI